MAMTFDTMFIVTSNEPYATFSKKLGYDTHKYAHEDPRAWPDDLTALYKEWYEASTGTKP